MDAHNLPVEQFPAIATLDAIRHGFTTRAAGIEVSLEKTVALQRLNLVHREIRDSLGLGTMPFATAEQVHGSGIAVANQPVTTCFGGVDGLVTDLPGLCLGIYVADCCALFLVDPVQRAIGLVHSGRKGTEFRIVDRALNTMSERFGTRPAQVIAQLSPCIRPPHYEIDFAAEIRAQLRQHGVTEIHDPQTCTASDLHRYYSYRAEKGRTGRMLALLALTTDANG